MLGLGGWIGCLVAGLLCYLLGPLIPIPPLAQAVRVIGIVLLVLAVVFFAIWIIGLVTGSAVVGMAAVL